MPKEHHGTILIIEDDLGVAALEQKSLCRAGYEVVTMATAQEAMCRLAQGGIELVVVDYRLPGTQTGLDFYEQMKAAGFQAPVIMVTGFSDETVVINALRAGVKDFLPKSAEYLDYLPEAVDRVLEQVRTEHQLAQSKARLSGIINSARDAIITADSNQRITLFNAAAERIFQRPASEAVGQPVEAFIPATNESGSGLARFVQAGYLCANWFEWRGLRKGGEEFPLEASISSARVQQRDIFIIIIRDITERKLVEQRLREQAALLDRATDAILVHDLNEQLLFWNKGAERLYGWTSEEALGQNANRLLSPHSYCILDQARWQVLEKGQWQGELLQTTKEGKEVSVESHWTLVCDENEQPQSILVINTDVTARKRLEAQFLRVQRMESLGTLASGVAHDLNNVLTPILMATELLKSRLRDSASQSLLGTLETSAQRAAEMVRQVLSFARGMDGKRAPLQLKHVLRDLENMLEHTLPKSIEIRSSIALDLRLISGDTTQLYQVMMNLCVNARDAMPGGGRIIIQAENIIFDENDGRMHIEATPGPYVRVTVADTGTGIAPEVLPKIFDPFFTTKSRGKGTGLGLSTVLGIVRSHSGFIDVHSELGKGTHFSIYLPALTSGSLRLELPNKQQLPVGRGELILVVDDEASVRSIAQATLEAHGYRVLTAGEGTEAVALFVEHREEVKVVLTDMMMPIMDGPATIRALRQLDAHARIIASSGLPATEKEAEHTDIGANAFLPKPYTAEQLLTALKRILDRVEPASADPPSAGSVPLRLEEVKDSPAYAKTL